MGKGLEVIRADMWDVLTLTYILRDMKVLAHGVLIGTFPTLIFLNVPPFLSLVP